jgi:hypothetical protein
MSGSELLPLQGGPTVPAATLQLLWSLEDRGINFTVDAGDIVVERSDLLTTEDRAALVRWKPHVLAIICYCQREEVVQ